MIPLIKHELKFVTAVFNQGINSTVRLGVRPFLPKEDLVLLDTEGNQIAKANIIRTVYTKLVDITDEDIRYQHTNDTRTVSGLLTVLNKVYGYELNKDDIMSIIYFTLESGESNA